MTNQVQTTDPLLEQFGACTDEVHPDLETALRAIREMGLHWVELLEYWGKPVVQLDAQEIDRTKALLEQYEMQVSAIGSSFLKPVMLGNVKAGEVATMPEFQQEMERLRASIRVANALGAPIVRTYGFRRDDMVGLGNPSPRLPQGGDMPDEMLEKIAAGLRIAAQEAADNGLILGLENVRSCWANSGVNTAKIVAATEHPALQVIWDPGNDYVSGGIPYPEGYEAVKPYICHMHIKDARVRDPQTGLISWEAIGQGEIDYVEQIQAWQRDGYSKGISLETHWHPIRENGERDHIADSRISFEGFKAALAKSRQA